LIVGIYDFFIPLRVARGKKQNTEGRKRPASVTSRRIEGGCPKSRVPRYELAFRQRFREGRPALKGGALYKAIPWASSGENGSLSGTLRDALDAGMGRFGGFGGPIQRVCLLCGRG